jgi:hypothetical protein
VDLCFTRVLNQIRIVDFIRVKQFKEALVSYTAFEGNRQLACGSLADVTEAVRAAFDRDVSGPVLVLQDATGQQVDLDLRGASAAVLPEPEPTRGPGRPRLGVVAREVTLLPQHWEWLGQQPGGASVTLRRLVEQARKASATDDRLRARREAAYRVMQVLGGALPHYDEISRALFAGDQRELETLLATWPEDVATYVMGRLTTGE